MSRLFWVIFMVGIIVLGGASSILSDSNTPDILINPARNFSPIAQAPPVDDATCSANVTQAIIAVGEACQSLGRNQACYGNQMLEASFREDADTTNIIFSNSGDIADLSTIQRISTTAYNVTTGTWGVAVIKAQANLPAALPGQNVTFLMYGDATVENPTPDMNIVRIQTRVGGVSCETLPNSAVVIQSPRGQNVTLNVNGADIIMGSTVRFVAEENGEMRVSTIEGSAVVNALGVKRVVPTGFGVVLPLGGADGLTVIGEPSPLRTFDPAEMETIPFSLLDEEIEISSERACLPPAGWTHTYRVSPGDTLSGIAVRANVSLQELQTANCIENAARILLGQSLAVPSIVPTLVPTATPTPTPSPTPTPTLTPVLASITASPQAIYYGNCTTIEWQVYGPENIYVMLNGYRVDPLGRESYCLYEETTFSLIAYIDNEPVAFASTTVTLQPTFTPG